MFGIFAALPLINECCVGRKAAAEQLASATGKNPSDSYYEKSHSKEWDFAGGTAASQLELIIRETYCFIVISKRTEM